MINAKAIGLMQLTYYFYMTRYPSLSLQLCETHFVFSQLTSADSFLAFMATRPIFWPLTVTRTLKNLTSFLTQNTALLLLLDTN